MKYIYLFPVEKFERHVDDKTIIRAWREGDAERYTPESFAELINDQDFSDEANWVRVIDDIDGSFEISSIHRDDLESIGYDTSGVDDSTMKELASDLADDYCEQLFWSSLPIFADQLKIPKHVEKEDKENEEKEQ
jgi:hypothetical protein